MNQLTTANFTQPNSGALWQTRENYNELREQCRALWRVNCDLTAERDAIRTELKDTALLLTWAEDDVVAAEDERDELRAELCVQSKGIAILRAAMREKYRVVK